MAQEISRAGPGLLTVKEVATYLGLSTCTAYRMVERREIPYVSLNGRGIRFKQADVDEWLEKKKANPLLKLGLSTKALTLSPVCRTKEPHGKTGGKSEMAKAKSKTRINFGHGAIYQRKTKDGEIRWYVDFKNAVGRRVQRIATDAQSPQDAAQALQDAVRQDLLQAGKLAVKPQEAMFEDFAAIYYSDYIVPNRKKPATEKGRLRVLVDFFGGRKMRAVTPMMIERFRDQRQKAGNSKSTINRYLAVMKKMYSLAINEGLLSDNPVKKVKFYSEADNVKERILIEDEEERLMAAAPDHLRVALTVALNTGMRLGEIMNLKWEHVDLTAKRVRVEKTKSGKVRFININGRLHEMLAKLRTTANDSSYVLPNEGTGKPYVCLHRSFTTACKKAGIRGLRFHDLRHTFATRLIQGGVDIETVRSLLGHCSIVLTQRYTHSNNEMKQRAVDLLAQKGPALGPKMGDICDTVVTREPNQASAQPTEIPLSPSGSVS
jgi:excisionase family DNA binding protein